MQRLRNSRIRENMTYLSDFSEFQTRMITTRVHSAHKIYKHGHQSCHISTLKYQSIQKPDPQPIEYFMWRSTKFQPSGCALLPTYSPTYRKTHTDQIITHDHDNRHNLRWKVSSIVHRQRWRRQRCSHETMPTTEKKVSIQHRIHTFISQTHTFKTNIINIVMKWQPTLTKTLLFETVWLLAPTCWRQKSSRPTLSHVSWPAVYLTTIWVLKIISSILDSVTAIDYMGMWHWHGTSHSIRQWLDSCCLRVIYSWQWKRRKGV